MHPPAAAARAAATAVRAATHRTRADPRTGGPCEATGTATTAVGRITRDLLATANGPARHPPSTEGGEYTTDSGADNPSQDHPTTPTGRPDA